jgi:hypothetical protein
MCVCGRDLLGLQIKKDTQLKFCKHVTPSCLMYDSETWTLRRTRKMIGRSMRCGLYGMQQVILYGTRKFDRYR